MMIIDPNPTAITIRRIFHSSAMSKSVGMRVTVFRFFFYFFFFRSVHARAAEYRERTVRPNEYHFSEYQSRITSNASNKLSTPRTWTGHHRKTRRIGKQYPLRCTIVHRLINWHKLLHLYPVKFIRWFERASTLSIAVDAFGINRCVGVTHWQRICQLYVHIGWLYVLVISTTIVPTCLCPSVYSSNKSKSVGIH